MLLLFVEVSFLSQNSTLPSAFAVGQPYSNLKMPFCELANPPYKWMEGKTKTLLQNICFKN